VQTDQGATCLLQGATVSSCKRTRVPSNNGDHFLSASGPNAALFDNGVSDVLNGGSGMNWFFTNLAQDFIQGHHPSERGLP